MPLAYQPLHKGNDQSFQLNGPTLDDRPRGRYHIVAGVPHDSRLPPLARGERTHYRTARSESLDCRGDATAKFSPSSYSSEASDESTVRQEALDRTLSSASRRRTFPADLRLPLPAPLRRDENSHSRSSSFQARYEKDRSQVALRLGRSASDHKLPEIRPTFYRTHSGGAEVPVRNEVSGVYSQIDDRLSSLHLSRHETQEDDFIDGTLWSRNRSGRWSRDLPTRSESNISHRPRSRYSPYLRMQGISSRSPDDDASSVSWSDDGSSRSSVSGAEREWTVYTQGVKSKDGSSLYKCIWKTHSGEACSYLSKRSLMKRHIEAVHLGRRPFQCDVCGKRFSQKTSHQRHMNGHTGEKPHKCKFCDESFADPSRRHIHMVADHDYLPKQSRNKVSMKEVVGPAHFHSHGLLTDHR